MKVPFRYISTRAPWLLGGAFASALGRGPPGAGGPPLHLAGANGFVAPRNGPAMGAPGLEGGPDAWGF